MLNLLFKSVSGILAALIVPSAFADINSKPPTIHPTCAINTSDDFSLNWPIIVDGKDKIKAYRGLPQVSTSGRTRGFVIAGSDINRTRIFSTVPPKLLTSYPNGGGGDTIEPFPLGEYNMYVTLGANTSGYCVYSYHLRISTDDGGTLKRSNFSVYTPTAP